VEIVLVRHAQPDWEPGGRAVDDPELTPFGHAQARCAAEALAGERFDHVYASPLRRVQETAAPICEALGMEAVTCSWLRELGLPSLAGHTQEQVQDYFANARSRTLEHWSDGLPGGESFDHFYERVSSGIESLLNDVHDVRTSLHDDSGWRIWHLAEREAHERLLIVAHEGTNAAILSHLLGIEPVPWTWMRFSGAWTGIHRVHTVKTGSGRIWSMQRFNDVTHLESLSDEAGDGRSTEA
jgi:broad specificity phosphatase PhoE